MTHPKTPSVAEQLCMDIQDDSKAFFFDEKVKLADIALDQARREAIKDFYAKVCERAESKMLKTGKLEGAHFASMKEIIAELENLKYPEA